MNGEDPIETGLPGYGVVPAPTPTPEAESVNIPEQPSLSASASLIARMREQIGRSVLGQEHGVRRCWRTPPRSPQYA